MDFWSQSLIKSLEINFVLNLFLPKYKAKHREEERASGIRSEIQAIDTLQEELSEKEEEVKNKSSTGNKKQSLQKEKATAEEMWLKAMKPWEKLKTGGENKWKECRKKFH